MAADVTEPAGAARVVVGGRVDYVAREEPLAVVVDDVPFVVLMRTPTGEADDLALVAGFLRSEGVVADADDIQALAPCRDTSRADRENTVFVRLAPGLAPVVARPVGMTSACGICGVASIDDIVRRLPPQRGGGAPVAPSGEVVKLLSERARPRQVLFAATGSVHGAALFLGADLVDSKEDVGRHNAVDKVLGRAFLDGRNVSQMTLWVSGRIAFEIVQKAAVAGVAAIVAVGGPTSLALDLATRIGLPLVAFARGDHANVYVGRDEAPQVLGGIEVADDVAR